MNHQNVINNIRNILSEYVSGNNLKSLVLGISGGIDSALCAVLANPVCKNLKIPLMGRSIPVASNRQDEITRAEAIGELFCTDFKKTDLTNWYESYLSETGETENDDYATKLRLGNVKARIRMIYLYDTAKKTKGMVLSTDNYTEYLLGFWTLHGDVGDFGMIQNLWKSEVYDIAKYIVKNELQSGAEKKALQECIDGVPTDGLGITSSDLEQLGAESYEQVDGILQSYLNYKANPEPVDDEVLNHPVIKRHLASGFKRNNPFNISRKETGL